VSRRQDRAFLAILIGVAVLWWIPQRVGPIDLRSDGAIYYILGTSLAQGQGYRLLNEPGDIRAVQYPPLLPLLVAAHEKALATSDFVVVGGWLRAFYFCVFVALVAMAYTLARYFLPPWRAFLAGLVSALALHVWYLAGVLYTEIPFSLIAIVFVLWARRADRRGFWLATAALGMVAYLLRTAGIALLIAWVLEALIRGFAPENRDRRFSLREAAARSVAALLPIIAWQAYIASVTSSPEYRYPAYPYQRAAYQYSNVTYPENISLVSPFAPERGRMTTAGWVSRLARNAAFIVPSLGGAVTAQRAFWELAVGDLNRFMKAGTLSTRMALVPMTAIGLVVLAGALIMVRRRQYLLPLCCGAAAVIMSVTPWPEQFVRYFAPMIPFISIMLVTALCAALDFTTVEDAGANRGRRWAARGLLLAVLTTVLAQDAYVAWWTFRFNPSRPVMYVDAAGRTTTGQLLFYEAEAAAMDEALEEVRRRAQPGDVVASSMPHWAYLRTGVKSILPPMEANPAQAQRLLDEVPVRFVVLDELQYPRISQRYAAPAVEGHPEAWRRIYRSRDGRARLYEHVR
jgi:hypothetical protein